jgi:hypothetical protein
MPTKTDPAKSRPAPPPKKKLEDKTGKELLRDQARTETEERPYLDTEGGE